MADLYVCPTKPQTLEPCPFCGEEGVPDPVNEEWFAIRHTDVCYFTQNGRDTTAHYLPGHQNWNTRISPASAAPVADNAAIRDLFALLEQDSQGQWCFKSLSRDAAKFQSAIHRLAATPTAAPQSKTIEAFRDLKPGWDSYGGLAINTEAIEIALRLAPLLPDWQPVPRSDGGIQFERGYDEICIFVEPPNETNP